MKQYYAITHEPNCESYITRGKKYPVTEVSEDSTRNHGRSFYLINDSGNTSYCLELGCAHLNGGSWELVEIKL